MDADRIIVMNDGKIVADGKHNELIDSCVEYGEIYATQMESGKAGNN